MSEPPWARHLDDHVRLDRCSTSWIRIMSSGSWMIGRPSQAEGVDVLLVQPTATARLLEAVGRVERDGLRGAVLVLRGKAGLRVDRPLHERGEDNCATTPSSFGPSRSSKAGRQPTSSRSRRASPRSRGLVSVSGAEPDDPCRPASCSRVRSVTQRNARSSRCRTIASSPPARRTPRPRLRRRGCGFSAGVQATARQRRGSRGRVTTRHGRSPGRRGGPRRRQAGLPTPRLGAQPAGAVPRWRPELGRFRRDQRSPRQRGRCGRARRPPPNRDSRARPELAVLGVPREMEQVRGADLGDQRVRGLRVQQVDLLPTDRVHLSHAPPNAAVPADEAAGSRQEQAPHHWKSGKSRSRSDITLGSSGHSISSAGSSQRTPRCSSGS